MTEQPLERKQNGGDEQNIETAWTDRLASSVSSSKQESGQSLEENLERLAAVNLSSDTSLEPRLSTAMIRLVSALAGVGFLLLLYLIFKIFV